MSGDYSRSTFSAANHYAGVRMQQGSVQLDADWNEQVDIAQHRLVTPLGDLLGNFAVAGDADDPAHAGFALEITTTLQPGGVQSTGPHPPDFSIGEGRSYVNGILCENEQTCLYSTQPDFPDAAVRRDALIEAGYTHFIVYLDVWQRHISAIEHPAIRDSALGGADTAARTQIVWQVKLLPIEPAPSADAPLVDAPEWERLQTSEHRRGRLAAQQMNGSILRDNQLYRVEIHAVQGSQVSFKWSRENGSVAYAVHSIEALPAPQPASLHVATGGHAPSTQATNTAPPASAYRVTLSENDPARLFLHLGDWVELLQESDVTNDTRRALYRIIDMQPDLAEIDLIGVDALPITPTGVTAGEHWIMRRWDQRSTGQPGQRSQVDRAGLVVRRVGSSDWITLENGLQVRFVDEGAFRPGDFWLIPTRTQLDGERGGVEWPQSAAGAPELQAPHGLDHAYAPLGLLHRSGDGWVIDRQPRAAFLPLPPITDKVLALAQRMTTVEEAVEDLKQRVEVIEEKVEWALSWLKAERAQLFYDYLSAVELHVGDLVALDPERADHIVRASHANETLLVGVLTKILAGRHGAPLFRVAMHGRTRCNIVGSVAPGALLVVSGYEGHAVQGGVFLRPGTVVGKALSSYQPNKRGAVGVVDVMVTLA
jgi:hypothetical protein